MLRRRVAPCGNVFAVCCGAFRRARPPGGVSCSGPPPRRRCAGSPPGITNDDSLGFQARSPWAGLSSPLGAPQYSMRTPDPLGGPEPAWQPLMSLVSPPEMDGHAQTPTSLEAEVKSGVKREPASYAPGPGPG